MCIRDRGESVNAFVVPKEPGLTLEELRTFCRDQLTGYKRPRHIEIRASLPKTNVGKILRRELRDEALAKKARRPQKPQPDKNQPEKNQPAKNQPE